MGKKAKRVPLAPSCAEWSGDARKNAFRVAKYATRQGFFVSCAFAPRVECCPQHQKNPREFECPPCNRFPAKATPQATRPTTSSWLAQALPACTCCTGCGGSN